MSGTFLNTESYDGATVTRTGNLNVSLAGPDAKIWAGRVGGMLVAVSEVKVTYSISQTSSWLTKPFKRLTLLFFIYI